MSDEYDDELARLYALEDDMTEDFGNNKVTVNKAELLAAMRKNRDEHREVFFRAQEGYRAKVIETLDRMLAEARSEGTNVYQLTAFHAPSDHTSDYDRVVRMLEMSLATEVQITEKQFSQYVLDEWNWKQDWVATNSSYGC